MLGIEEQIRNSSCYGVAYDGTLPECKRCDVSQRCSARCAAMAEKESETTVDVPFSQISRPPTVVQVEKSKATKTTQPAKPATVKQSKFKAPKKYSPDMPVLKNMSMDELKKLAVERKCQGLDAIDAIASQQIRRMRYIMLIKATYEIQ